MSQKIEPLNAAEIRWIGNNRMSLCRFAEKPDQYKFTAEDLDILYQKWISTKSRDEDPNPTINAFGVSFGQLFIDEFEMEWSVVTDEYGTEMAVCGQPGNVLIFPPNFVGKRYAAQETNFFVSAFAAMSQDIINLREKAKAKPWWKKW